MRIFFGVLASIVILTGATLTVLALWNIQPISWDIIWRSGITIAIVCITFLILWLVKVLFFPKDTFNKNNKGEERGI
ncbi:MAG: hypothetical protein E6767_01830 [Dysgonomonas sp.]|nr:hypothetical protein [Dysgonomonas sp.]